MATDYQLSPPDHLRAGVVRQLTPSVRRIIAPNPSALTYTGTCTYIVGRNELAVIDPGPLLDDHLDAICAAAQGQTIRHILITHTHIDHSPAAQALKEVTGADIIGCAPIDHVLPSEVSTSLRNHDQSYRPDHILSDGQRLLGNGYTFTAIATPGHACNHLCFAFAEEQSLFSGDHVMGWSTSVVAPPDGHMRDYLNSLHKLTGRIETVFWPGHGDAISSPQHKINALIAHRLEREKAIRQCLNKGDRTIEQIVHQVYRGLNAPLLRAASYSVLAHMVDLVERGLVRSSDGQALLTSQYALINAHQADFEAPEQNA
jgi:glyoxylase-like metal-dependent hydrolase (beta-lactamase superfamily II)